MNDPEIRKFCVYSLGKICENLIETTLETQTLDKIYKTLIQTVNDYTIDKRGDIGLIIRDQTLDSVY